MGKMEEALKAEVMRLTRKQFRQTVNPLTKDVRELKKLVSKLEKIVHNQEPAEAKRVPQEAFLQASSEEAKSARLSARAIKNIRKKLGISQEKLAVLLKVSPGAVAFWEQGRAKPRGDNKIALVALRKLGRRNIKKILIDRGMQA
jgi:DNA-binding transcriptional regulator YiaG